MKPRALDLFCCAGGATRGLQMAGYHVTGVDIRPQPRYVGDAFHQADALSFAIEGFDFIWASPPCQAFTSLRHMPSARSDHPNLIPEARARLLEAGVPWCIENVEGAPLGEAGFLTMLCGTMFGLQTPDGRAEIRRHRVFETSFSIALTPRCQHGYATIGSLSVAGDYAEVNANRKAARESLSVTGTGLDSNRERWGKRRSISVIGHSAPQIKDSGRHRAITVTGSTAQTNLVKNRVRETFTIEEARAAMGCPWMTMAGLSQAVPPAYAEFIGRHALTRGSAA